MRENQRSYGSYADNASAGMQEGRKYENNTESTRMHQEETSGMKSEKNRLNSEGITYLDIIPRFAL